MLGLMGKEDLLIHYRSTVHPRSFSLTRSPSLVRPFLTLVRSFTDSRSLARSLAFVHSRPLFRASLARSRDRS